MFYLIDYNLSIHNLKNNNTFRLYTIVLFLFTFVYYKFVYSPNSLMIPMYIILCLIPWCSTQWSIINLKENQQNYNKYLYIYIIHYPCTLLFDAGDP